MKRFNVTPTAPWVLLLAGLICFTTGCVERRVQFVPVYRAQTDSQPQLQPGPQTLYQPQPSAVQPSTTTWQETAQVTNAPQALAPQQSGAAVVAQAPPPVPAEFVPVAPGPDYYWVPGYWYWSSPGWIWMGGRWTIRPWHGAIWVRGGWYRHRGGWAWRGGHWR